RQAELERYYGPKTFEEIEYEADGKYLQQGWTKQPLKSGDGYRYFDGKGGSFQINRGYGPEANPSHSGPYVKLTEGSWQFRISIEQ
ncbi:MAG: hypothetical protein ABL962_20895, partial [Fimbriimonadaceae bacterium]